MPLETAGNRHTIRPWPGSASTPPSAATPAHYAALEAAFALGLGATVSLAQHRAERESAEIPRHELVVLALATFALADTIVKERISTWLREPFVVENADHRPDSPEGRGLRRVVGELLTCTRCTGTWSALGLVALRTASPVAGRTTANILALAGANDLIQGGFRLLSERGNQAEVATDLARRDAEQED